MCHLMKKFSREIISVSIQLACKVRNESKTSSLHECVWKSGRRSRGVYALVLVLMFLCTYILIKVIGKQAYIRIYDCIQSGKYIGNIVVKVIYSILFIMAIMRSKTRLSTIMLQQGRILFI